LVIYYGPTPLDLWRVLAVLGAVAAAGWFGVYPFLREYQTVERLAESASLNDAVQQISKLDAVAGQIAAATARWQSVQEASQSVATQAGQIVDRMTAETRAFTEFAKNANDAEKATLRLETEKARRAETEWIQVTVHILDHVYAVYQSAVKSGQRNLIENLGHFQAACRDAARRVGLLMYDAKREEPFDPKKHQVIEGDPAALAGKPVLETLAPGFTLQGRLIRPAMVRAGTPPSTTTAPTASETLQAPAVPAPSALPVPPAAPPAADMPSTEEPPGAPS
jgi:molecular chaperone GrpE (heat shock protein)